MGMYYGATLLYGFELIDDRESGNYVDDRDWEELEDITNRKGSTVEIYTPNYYGWDNTKFLFAKDSFSSAELGRPQVISWQHYEPEWQVQLNEFCFRYGFKYEEPDWYLIAYMH
jgi:hypothetical protein